MSALRLINETSATSVASVSITDVFSADFDIYKITILQDTAAGDSVNIRLINSSGGIITDSNYERALLQVRVGSSSGIENKSVNVGQMNLIFQGTEDFCSTFYIFNPFSSSSYTLALAQSAGYYGGAGLTNLNLKGIGVLKQTASMSGIKFTTVGSNFDDFTCRIYGLRVDT